MKTCGFCNGNKVVYSDLGNEAVRCPRCGGFGEIGEVVIVNAEGLILVNRDGVPFNDFSIQSLDEIRSKQLPGESLYKLDDVLSLLSNFFNELQTCGAEVAQGGDDVHNLEDLN